MHHDIEQGSYEWFKIKLNKITSSRIKKVFKTDNLTLVDELIREEVTGDWDELDYISPSVQRGIDTEPLAIEVYEKMYSVKTKKIGFIQSDKHEWLGVSPDGIIFENGVPVGGVEIKCPDTKTHIKYIRQDKVPTDYWHQVLSYFLSEPLLQYVDFMSYDDRFVIKPTFIKRVLRSEIEEELATTEDALVKFWEKRNEIYNQILFK